MDQSVAAKVSVVGLVAEITSVGPEFLSVRAFFSETLVCPVPNKSSDKAFVRADGVPVFLKVADGVAHGVGILAEDHRSDINRVCGDTNDFRDACIHTTDNINVVGVFGPAPCAFVVNRSGGVIILNPCGHGSVVRPTAGFVAERPKDNAWMVFISLNHPDSTLNKGICPAGYVGQ